MVGLTLLAILQAADPLAVVDDEIRGDHDMLHSPWRPRLGGR